MTPEEKALELREKCDGYTCYAEVVVDEILKASPTSEVSAPFLGTRIYDNKSYWTEVKQELEKL